MGSSEAALVKEKREQKWQCHHVDRYASIREGSQSYDEPEESKKSDIV